MPTAENMPSPFRHVNYILPAMRVEVYDEGLCYQVGLG